MPPEAKMTIEDYYISPAYSLLNQLSTPFQCKLSIQSFSTRRDGILISSIRTTLNVFNVQCINRTRFSLFINLYQLLLLHPTPEFIENINTHLLDWVLPHGLWHLHLACNDAGRQTLLLKTLHNQYLPIHDTQQIWNFVAQGDINSGINPSYFPRRLKSNFIVAKPTMSIKASHLAKQHTVLMEPSLEGRFDIDSDSGII